MVRYLGVLITCSRRINTDQKPLLEAALIIRRKKRLDDYPNVLLLSFSHSLCHITACFFFFFFFFYALELCSSFHTSLRVFFIFFFSFRFEMKHEMFTNVTVYTSAHLNTYAFESPLRGFNVVYPVAVGGAVTLARVWDLTVPYSHCLYGEKYTSLCVSFYRAQTTCALSNLISVPLLRM